MAEFRAVRVPGRAIYGTARWVAIPAIFAWAASRTTKALRKKPDGSPDFGPLTRHTLLLGVVVAWALLFLITQGDPEALGAHRAHVNIHGFLPTQESVALAYGLLGALLCAPEIVRRKLPLEHASEQASRLVPAGLAAIAALVTGSYLFALHFFNQPLARIPPGPLIASILAVMALVTPLYQLIARACWRYGLADLLDPVAWWAKGSEVTKEIMSYDRELREAGQTLAARERVLGPDHPDTLTSRNNLANAYQAAGRTDEAITLHEQNLTARERVLGPDHPDTLTSRNNLAAAYRAAGRLDEAIGLHEQTLAARERVLGPDHPDTLTWVPQLICFLVCDAG